MTERLICSNCGGPVTRLGSETSVTCAHCQTVTEFPPAFSASDDEDVSAAPRQRSRRDEPQAGPTIVIIQEGQSGQLGRVRQATLRRASFAPFLLAPIFFIAVSIGVSALVHMRAVRTAAAMPAAAERAVERAEKAASSIPEKKHH